jgi:hypothetical protein
MATRLFGRSTAGVGAYTISPAPVAYRNLVATGFTAGAGGTSVTLAAGASAFVYSLSAQFTTAIPSYTGTAVGSWKITHGFQTVVPANIFTKVRVHRGTLSGTVITIVATSEWSDERLTNKTIQRWETYLDQVDLGTWASTDRLIIEYNYRNAGGASITPQITGGGYYQNAIYSPFETSAAFGYANQLQVGQRQYNYSQGGIRGTSRYLKQTTSAITSSGTATGTKGGSDFSGSVTGISTSSGTVAAGLQGYTGASTGASTSSGTIAAGTQGYTGAATGASTSSGTIAAGLQGYSGTSTGSSTSTGSANGTPGPGPGPEPEPTGDGSVWRAWNQDFVEKKPLEVLALTGRTVLGTSYSFGTAIGIAAFNPVEFAGRAVGISVEMGRSSGQLGYYGGVMQVRMLVQHRARGKAQHDLRGNRELLLLIGEL